MHVCSYDKPPLEDITIEDFETTALDRLRVLAEIESCFARNRSLQEMTKVIDTFCKGKGNLELHSNSSNDTNLQDERRKDHIGHFVLRLAFCRSCVFALVSIYPLTCVITYGPQGGPPKALCEGRDYVVQDKTRKGPHGGDTRLLELEELRLGAGASSVTYSLEAVVDMGRHQASSEEIQELIPSEPPTIYYKVKWTRVPDLVEKRKVILKGGMAYVPATEQAGIVFQEFQTLLEKALEVCMTRLNPTAQLLTAPAGDSQGSP